MHLMYTCMYNISKYVPKRLTNSQTYKKYIPAIAPILRAAYDQIHNSVAEILFDRTQDI